MNLRYLSHIRDVPNIILVIMGKDPFPSDATGIPFCKTNWKQQLNRTSSGYVVLDSLGFSQYSLNEHFQAPADFFLRLASYGIIFLNLSYVFIGGKIRKEKHSRELSDAYAINSYFLEKTQNIVLCGEAKKNRWNNFTHTNIFEVVHPDIRNKSNLHESVRRQWQEVWSTNKLRDLYQINLEGISDAKKFL